MSNCLQKRRREIVRQGDSKEGRQRVRRGFKDAGQRRARRWQRSQWDEAGRQKDGDEEVRLRDSETTKQGEEAERVGDRTTEKWDEAGRQNDWDKETKRGGSKSLTLKQLVWGTKIARQWDEIQRHNENRDSGKNICTEIGSATYCPSQNSCEIIEESLPQKCVLPSHNNNNDFPSVQFLIFQRNSWKPKSFF